MNQYGFSGFNPPLTEDQIKTQEDLQYIAAFGHAAHENKKRLELSGKEKIRLRDEFAMAALTGILSTCAYFRDEAAAISYEYADAMLKAREATK